MIKRVFLGFLLAVLMSAPCLAEKTYGTPIEKLGKKNVYEVGTSPIELDFTFRKNKPYLERVREADRTSTPLLIEWITSRNVSSDNGPIGLFKQIKAIHRPTDRLTLSGDINKFVPGGESVELGLWAPGKKKTARFSVGIHYVNGAPKNTTSDLELNTLIKNPSEGLRVINVTKAGLIKVQADRDFWLVIDALR